MAVLCNLREIYGPKRALTTEQAAIKLVANQRARVEWDILRTTEWTLDEIKWRVIANRPKDEQRRLHDEGCLQIERDKRRSRLHRLIY
jgi:hypothetical protein